MKHVSIRVYGRVQGVFFRASAKEKADELGIFGSVRNEYDGSVAVEAEGEDQAIGNFVEWCKKGPRLASVERCELRDGDVQNLRGFSVLR
jgi:acylphosphatase